MKNWLLITALFTSLFLTPSYAEDYSKVIEEGRTLIYLDQAPMGEGPLDGFPSYYTFEGRIGVNGKIYHKLYSKKAPFTKGTEDTDNLIALMREKAGKVYLYTPEELCSAGWSFSSMDRETLLYDFTIPVGGSYVTEVSRGDIVDVCTVTLNSITTVEIDGKIARSYNYSTKVKNYSGYTKNKIFSFTEGIGPNSGIIAFPDNGLFMVEITNGSEPEHLVAIYDYENENLIYDSWGADPELGPGAEFRNVLSDGLDFEYGKYAVPVSGGNTGIKPGNMPMGSKVHYRVSGQRNVYGNTFYQIWRYEGGYNPKTGDLLAFMREEQGRLILHPWKAFSPYDNTLWRAMDDVAWYSMRRIVYDLNSADSEDTVFVNGEPRKHLRIGNSDFVEGLGVVRNGVLPFPGDDYSLAHGYEFRLNCIRDAEGNVIFSRDQLSGIDDVTIGEERQAETEYYDLTGRRVQAPAKGIYIVKDSAGVRKAVF